MIACVALLTPWYVAQPRQRICKNKSISRCACASWTPEPSDHLGTSKNKGTPKWMVKIMENPIKMEDLGVPLFSETLIYQY